MFDRVAIFVSISLSCIYHGYEFTCKVVILSATENGRKRVQNGPKKPPKNQSWQILKTLIPLDGASKTGQKTHRNLCLKMYLLKVMRPLCCRSQRDQRNTCCFGGKRMKLLSLFFMECTDFNVKLLKLLQLLKC